jgi:hypothetical protein
MVILSRRKILGLMMGAAAVLTLIPGCSALQRLFGISPKATDEWRSKAKEFWTARVQKRKAQRAVDRREGKRPDVNTPYPYIIIDRSESSHGYLQEQLRDVPLGVWTDAYVPVRNQGNAASPACYVEMYEGPLVPYHVKFSDMRFVSRVRTSLMAGQRKEVVLRWQTTRATNGSVVLRCYDPILDPCELVDEQFSLKCSGFSWQKWPGG